MNIKLRFAIANVISLLPANVLRVLLYRLLLGYRISGASIGWRTVIAVDQCTLDRCRMGQGNLFYGPMTVSIGAGTNIGRRNQFVCGEWATQGAVMYTRALAIGAGCLVTSEHYFDVVGTFKLGNGSRIGGCRSQFWTHGPGSYERDISIGERCYIGTGVIFGPGSAVSDNTIVAMGSVVTKPFTERNAMIAGQPARIVKTDYDWKTKLPVVGTKASAISGNHISGEAHQEP